MVWTFKFCFDVDILALLGLVFGYFFENFGFFQSSGHPEHSYIGSVLHGGKM
jgi:hypothetical protein